MTNDEELLVVLKNEMLLTRARAFGAKEAYEIFSTRVARSLFPYRSGNRIVIKFGDGELLAEFCSIEWADWQLDDYRGPAIFGWRILKSGAKSRTKEALCSINMWKSGLVEAVEKAPVAKSR
jgi:hypothetical protein